MQQLDTVCFTETEEVHGTRVHERDVLEVQCDSRSLASDLCPQLVEMLRANATTQAQNGTLAVGPFLDVERHLACLIPRQRASAVPWLRG